MDDPVMQKGSNAIGDADYIREQDAWTGMLLQACSMAGAEQGIPVSPPSEPCSREHPFRSIKAVAHTSGFFPRGVKIPGDWYTRDSGPLVGMLGDERIPVALLPAKGGYRYYNPATGTTSTLDRTVAEKLLPEAFMLYRKLPDEPIDSGKLIRFILPGNMRELKVIAMAGFGAALLGFLFPVLLGHMIDITIPNASFQGLNQIGIGLLVAVAAMALFSITRSFALVRLEGRIDSTVQVAIWRRLLSLPADFFSRFTAGDLALRSMGINTIRNILTGLTINSVMSLAFSSVNLLLMFYLDLRLAGVALFLLLVQTAGTFPLLRNLLRQQVRMYQEQGRNAGEILQLITGVLKIRMAAAEDRAYHKWEDSYNLQKEAEYGAGLVNVVLNSINAFAPVISVMLLYAVVMWLPHASLSTGRFMAFMAAFAGLQGAVVQMTMVMNITLNIVPIFRRLSPILRSLPENPPGRESPGELTGRVRLEGVCFRYEEQGPDIVKNIRLDIDQGEFIAITGPSGSGKSTLLRLLLGFSRATDGSIYYDDKEINDLDIIQVRRQMGIVLQKGKVVGGELYRCILGARNLGMDAAWEAAEAVGLTDEIKALPMGMHTIVPPGGGTFSGGQLQRILIAQAIVARPKIMFFDEATSALDNRSQAIVSGSIQKLGCTRLVIAHRLSTIKDADRIVVLIDGKVVEMGTYSELMARRKAFYKLAQRQLL